MAKTLKLGEGLELPADEAVTQKYGFIGRSGSGKSYAAMRLAELFLGHGAQIIALDWVGIWWSLRLAKNGKHDGFKNVYIFGGEHADVELKPESGALMADLVVDKHISVVLDVMHFRKAERTRFATAFAEQFFHRKKTARTACHLFIEEAQAYLPQFVRGEEARMVGVFEDIGKVGRNYGIGNSLISQRPQAINKDVLNQVEVLLAFQTNGPQERKAIAGWTSENTTAGVAMIQQLPTLKVGHALAWSPQWLRLAGPVAISQRDTYNSSSTPTGNAASIAPKTLAKADLEQLGAEMAAIVEKAKADSPAELKKQLAAARAELAKRGTYESAPSNEGKKPQVTEVEVLTDTDRKRLDDVLAEIRLIRARLDARASVFIADVSEELQLAVRVALSRAKESDEHDLAQLAKLLDKPSIVNALAKLENVENVSAPAPKHEIWAPGRAPLPASRPVKVRTIVERSSESRSSPSEASSLPPGELAVLKAAAQWPEQGVTRDQLGVLTGYKRSTRDAYILRMINKGLITLGHGGGQIMATKEGIEALGSDYEPLPTGDALYDWWRGRLPIGELKILDVLVAAGGKPIARDTLDEQTGFARSSRDAYLSRLAARRLVQNVGRGEVCASAELFS